MADSRFLQVDLEPVGRRVTVPPGSTLLDAAQAAGVELAAVCGGVGICGKCRVRLMSGELKPPTDAERDHLSAAQLASGYRLACMAKPLSKVKIDIPPESLVSAQRLQVEGLEEEFEIDPVVVTQTLDMQPPSLDDLDADTWRLHSALARLGTPARVARLSILSDLSDQLRDQSWRATVALNDGEIVGVLPPGARALGLAVDIGTTKMAAYLVDLATGDTLVKGGETNPQVSYGEDVLSRIGYANDHDDGRKALQSAVVQRLNKLVADLCDQAGADTRQVLEVVLVGNTAMHHLVAGLPVRQLGFVPYVPAVASAMTFPAREIGLDLGPGSNVYLPPNIAGFVGGDHVAMLMAIGALDQDKTIIAIDIGTNTEVSLVRGRQALTCSCASGPAFEGAHIRDGMRAVPGAIEKVNIQGGQVYLQMVGDKPPVGICGSGILDAIAEMLRNDIIARTGRLQCADPDLAEGQPCTEFTLAGAETTGTGQKVVVTQADVREIQLAKGAIRAGIETLLKTAGMSHDGIDEFVIAGAFGTYLDIESAIGIGMFPPVSTQRVKQVGNAAGSGAKMMLTSRAKRREAEDIVSRVEYIELTTSPGFTRLFAHAMRY